MAKNNLNIDLGVFIITNNIIMKLLIAVAFILDIHILFAQNKIPNLPLNTLANDVVLLYKNVNDTVTTGTGNIISYKNKFFIVTAKHVAESLNNSTKVIFRIPEGYPKALDLIFFTKSPIVNWSHHPKADISLIEIFSFNSEWSKRLLEYSFPSDWIIKNVYNPLIGVETVFFGFPDYSFNN